MIVVLLVWTAGVAAVWVIAELALNPGVSQEDIQECMEEGFIPPEECEEALENLEAGDEAVIGSGGAFVVWFVGFLVLLLVMTRPRPADSR
jgi:hypothetical protein